MSAMAKVLGNTETESDPEELMAPNLRQHGLVRQESRMCRVGASQRQVGTGGSEKLRETVHAPFRNLVFSLDGSYFSAQREGL